MPTIVWILIVLLVGAGGGFAGYTYRQKMVEEKINRSEETAKRLYEDAVRKATNKEASPAGWRVVIRQFH